MLEVGDVLFYKGTSPISRIIATVEHSPWTHVGIYIGDGRMVEANAFIRTRDIPTTDEPDFIAYRIPNLTDEQKRRIVEYVESKIGTHYDYEKIIGLFIRFEFIRNFQGFEERNHFICSELVDLAFHYAGVPRRHHDDHLGDISPSELFYYYGFEQVDAQSIA